MNLSEVAEVGAIAPNSIVNADCLEAMKFIPDKSIDCIITDLPYGITQCKWDTVIPFEPLWEQYKRIIKPNGAIVLFGSQPFTSALVMSNPKWFRYEWIWDKVQPTGFLDANRKPLKLHENILVFAGKRTNYYPQKTVAKTLQADKTPQRVNLDHTSIYGKGSDGRSKNNSLWKESGYRYPLTIQKISNHNGCLWGDTSKSVKHPTQKPIALLEYLIKTYTIEGELILDNTAGSGSLAIAAINTKRNYICIEKDDHYFQVMQERIANHDAIAPPPKKSKPRPVPEGQLSLF